jgi:hypothetical protein
MDHKPLILFAINWNDLDGVFCQLPCGVVWKLAPVEELTTFRQQNLASQIEPLSRPHTKVLLASSGGSIYS